MLTMLCNDCGTTYENVPYNTDACLVCDSENIAICDYYFAPVAKTLFHKGYQLKCAYGLSFCFHDTECYISIRNAGTICSLPVGYSALKYSDNNMHIYMTYPKALCRGELNDIVLMNSLELRKWAMSQPDCNENNCDDDEEYESFVCPHDSCQNCNKCCSD